MSNSASGRGHLLISLRQTLKACKMATQKSVPGSLGAVDSRINVHAFFCQTDARYWHDVAMFFKFRDFSKTAHEHYEIFMQGLKTIANHSGVPKEIQKRARFLQAHTQYDMFVDKFADLVLKAGKQQAEASVQGLHLHIAQGAGRIRSSSTIAISDGSQTIPQKRTSTTTIKTTSSKKVAQPTSASKTSSDTMASAVTRNDLGRVSSVSSEETFSELQFHIDPEGFEYYSYEIDGANVGRLFRDYQRASTALVNKPEIKTNLENLPHFLQLDEQMAEGKSINVGEVANRELRSIVLFYEVLELKLPTEYLTFENEAEDTYCHSFIDALFTRQFPAKSQYRLEWANKQADGSKERRGNGYKPDVIVSKLRRELAFVEIKPPREQRCSRPHLEDLWKLANFCKDAIDLHLRSGVDIRKAAAVQIFDTCRVVPCLRLMLSLEQFLDTIDANPTPRTPPRAEVHIGEDHSEGSLLLGRISKITPTTRRMF
ncbi:hypothetical protein EDD11_001052 [Mortierella claussenii]|nr:hypothetical protein EDD11_001052 [Mortierella claussenii]